MNRLIAQQLDRSDPLAPYREQFCLRDNMVYLCGHSLGAMPLVAETKVADMLRHQWGNDIVRAWNTADWIGMPARIGNKISRFVGAAASEVIVADSTSVNLYKMLVAALQLRPERTVIVTEDDNFPADLYIAEAVAKQHKGVTVVRSKRADILSHVNQHTAVLMVTHVNYRTSEVYDLKELAEHAHKQGALLVCDLAHSAGILPLALSEDGVDFAVGCGYKYLNGGPGAPAFLYVAERHQQLVSSPLAGWMGHQAPFSFEADYVPADGVRRFLCGTQPVLSMGALEASVDMLTDIPIQVMRKKSQALGDLMIKLLADKCPAMQLVSPVEADQRGGHVAYTHPEAYAINQALLAQGVIGDYRAPDLIRFGLSPLYLRYEDIVNVVETVTQIVSGAGYKDPIFYKQVTVT